jgi:hypothetical protein
VLRKGQWENTMLGDFVPPKSKDWKLSPFVGFYTDTMKSKVIETNQISSVPADRRLSKRGQICDSQPKKQKQVINKKVKDMFIKELGDTEYSRLIQVVSQLKSKKDHCEIIEIMFMWLSMAGSQETHWYSLLDDFEKLLVR